MVPNRSTFTHIHHNAISTVRAYDSGKIFLNMLEVRALSCEPFEREEIDERS